MKAVVIGGHSRNVGKTSVMAELIRAHPSFNWTAAKITQYGHGICSEDGEPCGCEPTEHAFVLTEETDPAATNDTSRFLGAGARRALWLRVRQGQLAQAFPLLEKSVERDEWVMIESNSVMEFLKPALYLFVLDSSRRDFKDSARRYLSRADALVPIGSRLDARAWQGIQAEHFADKPVFPVDPAKFSSVELCRFVADKLRRARENSPEPETLVSSLRG